MKDENGSHLFEQLLLILDSTKLYKIYADFFRGKLASIAVHPISNFVFQRMIDSIKTASFLQLIFEELISNNVDLIKSKRDGVLKCLVDACRRIGSCHNQAMSLIFNSLEMVNTNDRIELVPKLLASNINSNTAYNHRKKFANINKALILQCLFSYPQNLNDVVVNRYSSHLCTLQLPSRYIVY